jgi:four helix bundle protein
MPTVKRFEDLHTWQAARELVKMIYEVTNLPAFNRDFGLRDQIRRAAVSVMSNIAEGFGAGSDAEFVKFLGYARRSNAEVQSQCYAALDQKYLTETHFQELYTKANILERQINTLITYLHHPKTSRNSIKDQPAEYIINIDTPETG